MRTSQYRPGRNPNSLKNLKRNTDRDPEELREMGRKGGIASGKTRRRKALLKHITQNAIEFMDFFRVMELSFSDMSAELGLPESETPRLVWLVLNLLSDLREENRHDILTLEALREIGLTEERAAEILRRWDQAMKETPEPDEQVSSMIQKYRQACEYD